MSKSLQVKPSGRTHCSLEALLPAGSIKLLLPLEEVDGVELRCSSTFGSRDSPDVGRIVPSVGSLICRTRADGEADRIPYAADCAGGRNGRWLSGQSSGPMSSGWVISTAPKPGSGPSMKNISTVMSGSTWAWDRKAMTFRPVSSLIVCL